ncbi:hypothetical protein [Bradyrhizobium sp.]|uniref:hypothetical protein n=1 Tax=Bradyrhizobium sp. TaxID=376 RepID=UPI0025C54329|nr:hypothetical protein [Bradyrhizobium sp.]
MNDVPTFSVGSAFLQIHRPLTYDAGQQIDQGAFVVIQMTSALFVGGLQENLLRPPQLGEGFVRAKFPRSLSNPSRYVVPSVLHFFAFSPSCRSCRTADDRVVPFFAAQVSTASMISSGALTVKSGSLPVAGRPGRFCCRFCCTFIDFAMVSVVP